MVQRRIQEEMKRKAGIYALAGLLAVSTLTGCSSSIGKNDVAITVGDTKISGSVANFYARYTQAQYETYYAGYMGDDMWNSEADKGQTYEEFVKDTILEQLEDMAVLEQHMDEYEVSLSDGEKQAIKEAAQKFDEANGLDDKEKVSGDEDTVERVMTLMAIQEKMRDAIQAGADTEVSDEEAAQKSMQYVFFSSQTTDSLDTEGTSGEDSESSDMEELVKETAKAQAESFAETVKDQADFAAYASEQGLEASTATFDADSQSPAPEVVEAADKLNEGETTGVIETDSGYYVARVTSLFDQEATDTEKQNIIAQRQTDLYNETCDGWKEETDIKVNNRVWDKIDFQTLSVTYVQDETEDYANEVQTDDVAEQEEEAEE